jgi:P27 family predicted phage terminase small subunit
MKGRKPKPVELRLVTGNPGKRPIRRVPKPNGQAARPAWLSPKAANEWRRLAPQLNVLGLLTSADRAFFAAYCEAFASWRHANNEIARLGEIVLDADGSPVKNPWMRIRTEAASEMHRFGSEFGLSPASRTRVGSEVPDENRNEDPAARYFG